MTTYGARDKLVGGAGMQPVFLDLDRLRDGRRRGERDGAMAAAVGALGPVRDKVMDQEVLSVCDKTRLAPSGDPHDYLSIPTYLWPDPTTDDGLPWIRRDGEVNPDAARTDVGRLFQLVDRIEVLALAAWYCDDRAAGARAMEMVRAWFLDEHSRMNPSLEYAQLKPGHGRGSHWGIIDFQRGYHLLDLLAVLEHCGHTLSGVELAEVQEWFARLRTWLVSSENGRAERTEIGNHGTWYDVQVVAYSLFLGDVATASAWLDDVTTPRLMAATAPDGRQERELCRAAPIEYSVFNLFGFVVLAEMARSVGCDLWCGDRGTGDRLAAGIDWLLPYLGGQRRLGRTTKHRGTFTIAAEATMVLRVAGDRLGVPDYLDAVDAFALHRADSRVNLLVPPVASGSKPRPVRVVSNPSPPQPYRKAFVVGCPRSGTVWTLDILKRHPLTIVGPESHLFSQIYTPLVSQGSAVTRRRRTLEHFDSSLDRLGSARGPQCWIGRDELVRALRPLRGPREVVGARVVGHALDTYFASRDGTAGEVLIEKTPDHVHWADRILDRWPEAKIVELLRDGRDVVTSLGHMSWAPADRSWQIQKWVDAVEAGQRFRESPGATGRWHVLRFEELKADPRREISRLFDFLELPWDEALVELIATETDFARMQRSTNESVHRRRGVVGGWRTELTDDEVALIEQLAGPTLEAAGYSRG